jgi:hypothetical protein
MQNGQPVAYTSRALTPTETCYAQIEKELLAIVFACDRFEAYIYGRKEVNVESDHQPLEMIIKKPLHSAPKRLQRMLLQLQKYNLVVRYKKGRHMYLPEPIYRRSTAVKWLLNVSTLTTLQPWHFHLRECSSSNMPRLMTLSSWSSARQSNRAGPTARLKLRMLFAPTMTSVTN